VGVEALSANDIWAVGSFQNTVDPIQTLIERWNGSSWSVVPSPDPGVSAANYLSGIDAVSANDIWAVGAFQNTGTVGLNTLIEHWNGSNWSVIPSPNPSSGAAYNTLNAIKAVSANNIWAVGYTESATSNPNQTLSDTLIEHWNGSNWSIVPSPNPNALNVNYLRSVAAVSTNDIWIVGQFQTGAGFHEPDTFQTLIEHITM
jgi:hypothetical protein